MVNKLKGKYWLISLASLATVAFAAVFLIKNHHDSSRLKPVVLTPRSLQTPYARQLVLTEQGGELKVDETSIKFPAQFSDQDLVVAYRRLNDRVLPANAQIGSVFELTAKKPAVLAVDSYQTSPPEQQLVTQFDQPLTITIDLTDEVFKQYRTNKIGLYYFETSTKRWQPVESRVDQENKQLIATTNHFTDYVVAGADPNQGVEQNGELSFIVDNSDPEPAFIPGGYSDPNQPQFWGEVGSGYNNNAYWTGNSIDNTPRNWGTWSIYEGLEGEVEVIVTIPDLRDKPLTQGATYVVTHAGGKTAVTVDQEAHRGGSASQF